MAAAPVDPWSAGLMALGGVASGAVNDKTNMTNQAAVTQSYDASGWAVNIGSGTQTATSSPKPVVAAAVAGAASLLQNPMVLAALAVALYLVLKKK